MGWRDKIPDWPGGGGGGGDISWPDIDKPQWVTTITTASALGVYLKDDPVGFVQAVIYQELITGLLFIFGSAANTVRNAFAIVTDAMWYSANPLLFAGKIVGDAIYLDLILPLITIAGDLVSAAGPFAPIVAIVIWAIVVYLLASLLSFVAGWLPWT